jgi:hypothetical protein
LYEEDIKQIHRNLMRKCPITKLNAYKLAPHDEAGNRIDPLHFDHSVKSILATSQRTRRYSPSRYKESIALLGEFVKGIPY